MMLRGSSCVIRSVLAQASPPHDHPSHLQRLAIRCLRARNSGCARVPHCTASGISAVHSPAFSYRDSFNFMDTNGISVDARSFLSQQKQKSTRHRHSDSNIDDSQDTSSISRSVGLDITRGWYVRKGDLHTKRTSEFVNLRYLRNCT